jgi:hypothetical protein
MKRLIKLRGSESWWGNKMSDMKGKPNKLIDGKRLYLLQHAYHFGQAAQIHPGW